MTFKKGDEVLIKGTVLSFEKGEILDLEIATSENTFFVNSEDVQVLPKKVVIPKFVAEWIEERKRIGAPLRTSMDTIVAPRNVDNWLLRLTNRSRHQELFARAWLDGYEIEIEQEQEQEQLYTVEISNPHHDGITVLEKIAGDIVMSQMDSISVDWQKEQDYQLTEAEIKQDFDWAWKWAEPVGE